ncbi:hypothetical protein Tco_0530725 [Tanacetum coccineum]
MEGLMDTTSLSFDKLKLGPINDLPKDKPKADLPKDKTKDKPKDKPKPKSILQVVTKDSILRSRKKVMPGVQAELEVVMKAYVPVLRSKQKVKPKASVPVLRSKEDESKKESKFKLLKGKMSIQHSGSDLATGEVEFCEN